jgi:transaldolase
MEGTSMTRPKTKILVDGGDPQETRQVKALLGFVDGQTTNPSLIAKNPHIKELIASGHKLSKRKEMDEYRKIVQTISPLVGDAGVSIEVFSDEKTTAQEMFSQGQEMFSWITNAYIKYPCTAEGLRAAQNSVKQGMRVNMTLCFSQQQAAAVYAATKGTKEPAYVSPFVGRLDDIGQNGMDVVKNIKRMFSKGDGHVLAWLRASAVSNTCSIVSSSKPSLRPCPRKSWNSGRARISQRPTTSSITRLPVNRFLTRSLTWISGGRRLIFNTSLRAKVSKNSLLTIELHFRDLH